MNVPGADWSKHKATLVFAVSKNCHFCDETAPAFKRLMTAASAADLGVAAIVIGAIESNRTHMEALGVRITDIWSASSAGIELTPTTILVDREGLVESTWLGRLTTSDEREIIQSFPQ